jgi:hypothetical protein
MDGLDIHDLQVIYHWTLTGTSTAPGGTGNHLRISGFEEWRFDSNNLIAESREFFNSEEYLRQLNLGHPINQEH